jgi:chromatin structure-remodeling complex subunit RSC4
VPRLYPDGFGQTTFAKLMADMPEPFALPQYTSPSVGKIKLKRPGAPAAATTAAPAPAAVPTPPPAPEPTLPKAPATVAAPPTLPQASASKPSAPAPAPQPALPVARATVGSPPPAKTPARAPAPPPAAVRTPLPKAMPAQRLQPKPRAPVPAPTAVAPGLPYMPAQAAPAPAPVPMPMPVPATPTPSAHYPNAAHYSAQTASAPYLPVPKPTAPSAPLALPVPPPTAADRPLSRATVVLAGSGRVLRLTTAAGVRAWHVRLAPAEPGLTVSGLGFLYDEPVDEAMDVDDDDASPRTKKKKGKRGKKTKDAQPPAKPRVRATVRLNETVLAPLSGKDADEWYITPAVGAFNVVEMGSEGGAMWRLYVDRAQ